MAAISLLRPIPDDNSINTEAERARATFRNEVDAVAFSIHSTFVFDGYELRRTGRTATSSFRRVNWNDVPEIPLEYLRNWNSRANVYKMVYTSLDYLTNRVNGEIYFYARRTPGLNIDIAITLGNGRTANFHLNAGNYARYDLGRNSVMFTNLTQLLQRIRDWNLVPRKVDVINAGPGIADEGGAEVPGDNRTHIIDAMLRDIDADPGERAN